MTSKIPFAVLTALTFVIPVISGVLVYTGLKLTEQPGYMESRLEVNGYRVYFGNTHAHTSISDGELTPADAFEYARVKGRLDFMILTDHVEQVSNDEWKQIVYAADTLTVNDKFVAIAGFEYAVLKPNTSYIPDWENVLDGGHITVWNPSRTHVTYTLEEFYSWLSNQQNTYAGFAHPGDQKGVFNNLALNKNVKSKIAGIEIFNGGRKSFSKYYPYYIQALDKGWYIAPTGVQDNHGINWGTRDDIRTAVLAKSLTREAIIAAIANRRIYATSDKNFQLLVYAGDSLMGSIIKDDHFAISLKFYDPDRNDTVRQVEIVTNNGRVLDTVSFNNTTATYAFPMIYTTPGKYFFVKIMQNDGDIIVSAPFIVE